MRTLSRFLAAACCLAAFNRSASAAGDLPADFQDARWIWAPPAANRPALDMPVGAVFFRTGFAIPEDVGIASAEVVVTADNLFAFHLNGRAAGEGHPNPNDWNKPCRFDVRGLLAPGWNAVAVEAVNTADGPAGLLFKLVVRMADGRVVSVPGSADWKCSITEEPNWQQPDFNDQGWRAAHDLGALGIPPWGQVQAPSAVSPAGRPEVSAETAPSAGFKAPSAIAFIGGDCSLSRQNSGSPGSLQSLSVTIFNPRDSKAFPEHDLPAPMKVGRTLQMLRPAGPTATPSLLLDAGRGAIGSPSASFDGRNLLFSMAREGDAFFHIYRMAATGGVPRQLTTGPFHDIDPAELPDGRIVFTSTRVGTFEEYHNPPSRALFTMQTDGRGIRLLTPTFIFDNEPEVMADGRIVFIRSDNFFDRGKVETLLHAIHPDGTRGYTEFGLDLGPEYGGRLRAFHCGSPAPLPDGRVAFVTASGIAVGRPGSDVGKIRHLHVEAGEVAALPDGRLLCTLPRRVTATKVMKGRGRAAAGYSYERIAVLDPDASEAKPVVLFDGKGEEVHSPVFVGARPVPPHILGMVDPAREDRARPTGVLYCQDARFTRNTTAGWSQIRAVRVLAGKGLTLRSSHSYIVHAGSEVTELGTVPLQADGSFAVEVPADTAIAFQMVDAEGRSELNEMSWIYVRPGEVRGCVGCHSPRQSSPREAASSSLAFAARPVKLDGGASPHRFRGNNAAVTGLMELQFDRYREVAGIGRHERMGVLKTGAQEIADWIAKLDHREASVRLSAVNRLALARDRAAAPALLRRLNDGEPEVRLAATFALAACGTRDSVPGLVAACGDEHPVVARGAAIALENLTGRTGAWPKVSVPWPQLEQEAIGRLTGPDRGASQRAAATLGHMGGDAARTALRDYVTRERENNPYPAWRKNHHGDGARFNAIGEANPRALQAALRALGTLGDEAAVPLLADTLLRFASPVTGNLFAAEAAAEALGQIGSPAAESALIDAFARLPAYQDMVRWYGDHDALIACHASPVHYYILQALDARGATQVASIVPHIVRSIPTDPDRALLAPSDDYETLAGRVINRSGRSAPLVEACFAALGEPASAPDPELVRALSVVHGAWAGTPDERNRAAQILSLLCHDRAVTPRLLAALQRYVADPVDIPRVFDTGIPVVKKLPARHWVCFYLARSLGNLADQTTGIPLRDLLAGSATESAAGRPDPLGPGVHFLHNDLTPCWRAEVAWALGRVGERTAAPLLLKLVADLENAPDTRYAAAEALLAVADADAMRQLAALAADYPEVAIRQLVRDRLPVGGGALSHR